MNSIRERNGVSRCGFVGEDGFQRKTGNSKVNRLRRLLSPRFLPAGRALPSTNEIDDIRRRLQFSHLLAKGELLEIERASLLREVYSPLTSQDRREEVMLRRFEIARQCAEISIQLKIMGDPRKSSLV